MLIDTREDARWTVYVHIVPKAISGYNYDKYYVGITCKTPKHRWGKDGKGYTAECQPHFARAIGKYGWNNIQHTVVAHNLTESEAESLEKALIKALKSKGKYGYNHTDGGKGFDGKRVSNKERKNRHAINCKPVYLFDNKGEFIQSFQSITVVSRFIGVPLSTCTANMRNHVITNGFYLASKTDITINDGEYNLKEKDDFKIPYDDKEAVYEFDIKMNYKNKYNSMLEAYYSTHNTSVTITKQTKKNIPPQGKQNIWRSSDQVSFEQDLIAPIIPDDWYTVYLFDSHGNYISRYISPIQASLFTGIEANAIRHSASSRKLPLDGNVWRYKKDVYMEDGTFKIKQTKSEKSRMLFEFTERGEFAKCYLCMLYAVNETKISEAIISGCARVLRKSTKSGRLWRRYKDVIKTHDGSYIMIE